jgi:hypothetical protein
MSWFLIPAQTENIVRSLSNPVAPEEVRQFLGDAESKRLALLGDGKIRCWAMTDGTKSQFDKMNPGDHVLFSEKGTKKFNYFAEVTAKVTSEELGDYLWPIKPRKSAGSSEDKSWQFIYFLKDLRSIDVDKSRLVVLLGHDEKDAVAASRKLDADKLATFEAAHGPLLQWLRTNAKLELPIPPARIFSTKKPEPSAPLAPQHTIGNDYVAAVVRPTVDLREQTFTYNTEDVERGRQGHVDTQNALASFLGERGIVPRRPATGEPSFDLAWMVGDTVFVAEVKSTTDDNEEHQLRLGLGQVLRYWDQIAVDGRHVVAVLVPERDPRTPGWPELCARLGVLIAWPGKFERVLVPARGAVKAPW